MTKQLNKKELLAAMRIGVAHRHIEGLGKIPIKQVSVEELDVLRAKMKNKKDEKKDDPSSEFGLRMIVISVVDESGAAVFDDNDIEALQKSNGGIVTELVSNVLEVNGFKKPAEKN